MMLDMTDVAVLGMGAMGSRMARRLLDAGHRVAVWNRTPDRMEPLLEAGATAAATPAEATRSCEVVITMLANDAALRDVTEGADGVAAAASDRTTMIQMSTVGPATVARLAAQLPPETRLLDAPVLGSVSEVEAGSLRIFVGGADDDVARWTPLLSTLGRPMHVGAVGSGAAAKLVANSTLIGVIGVFGEALALAEGVGLPRDVALDVLATTALGAQVERRRDSIESGEYPPRFSLALAAKDAQLIADAAAASGMDLRVLQAARTWLVDARDAGLGDQDYSAVLAYILGDRQSDPVSREFNDGR
jgi:3-hydroxyisobutyrate dehydrogenase-like beta-hydroxyacid dehydrogenase